MWGASRFAGWPIFWRRTGSCFWGADFLRQMERDVQPSLRGLWCARPSPATEVAGYFLGVLNKTREYQIPGTSVLGFTVSPLSGWFQPRHRVCATSIRVSPERLSPDESGQDATHAGGGARATKNSAAGAGVGFAHEQDSAL